MCIRDRDRFADDDAIKIIRRKEGKQQVLSVNYDQLIKGESLESNILLMSGDTVVVP